MSDSRRKPTSAEVAAMFVRYHGTLKAQGRVCGCCPEKLDAEEVEKAYQEAKGKA